VATDTKKIADQAVAIASSMQERGDIAPGKEAKAKKIRFLIRELRNKKR